MRLWIFWDTWILRAQLHVGCEHLDSMATWKRSKGQKMLIRNLNLDNESGPLMLHPFHGARLWMLGRTDGIFEALFCRQGSTLRSIPSHYPYDRKRRKTMLAHPNTNSMMNILRKMSNDDLRHEYPIRNIRVQLLTIHTGFQFRSILTFVVIVRPISPWP